MQHYPNCSYITHVAQLPNCLDLTQGCFWLFQWDCFCYSRSNVGLNDLKSNWKQHPSIQVTVIWLCNVMAGVKFASNSLPSYAVKNSLPSHPLINRPLVCVLWFSLNHTAQHVYTGVVHWSSHWLVLSRKKLIIRKSVLVWNLTQALTLSVTHRPQIRWRHAP